MEFTLLWAVLTGVGFGWLGLRIWGDGLADHSTDRLIAATLTGLVVGRLVAMVGQGVNPISHPTELIVIRGGVDTAAATIGFVVSLVWSTRKIPGAVDAMAPAVLLGLAGWHAGCLWRNACLGTPSNLPWAWAQDGGAVTRHPVELYAAIALLIGAFLISRFGWRPWLRTGAALGLAGAVRLITQPLRPSLSSGVIRWYLAAISLGLLWVLVGPRLTTTSGRASRQPRLE